METKKVIILLDPITVEVPEDWTEDQITRYAERTEGFKVWKYEDEWRN